MMRDLVIEDIPSIAGWLLTIPFFQRYGLTESRLTDILTTAQHADWVQVYEDAQKPIGLIWCIVDGAFGRSPYLRLLAIDPAHHGKGIGATMMHTLEAVLSQSYADLFLLTSDFNTEAQAFYQRLGYHHIGTIPAYVVPDVDEHIYHKKFK